MNSLELFDGIRAGNPQAYEFVFKAYYPRLRAYASRFVNSPDDLNDILQECFVKLWENRERLTNISISALLYTMVRNSCLNFLRHQLLINQCSIDDLSKHQESEQLYNLIFLNNPEEDLVCEELASQINEMLDALPEQSRKIFKMSREEGLKNREIAEKLGVSVKTVEYHMFKALSVFREFADKYNDTT
jgi:RNA polymerase sigma-70 factor (family 1)